MSDFKTYAVKRMKEHNDIVSMFFFFNKSHFFNKNNIYYIFFYRSVSEERTKFVEVDAIQRLDNLNVSSSLNFLNNILIR